MNSEQEGEGKKSGSDTDRRISVTSNTSSLDARTGRLDLQPSGSSIGSIGTPSSMSDMSLTPGNLGGQTGYQASPGGSATSQSRSPRMGNESYRPSSSSGGHGYSGGYTLASHSPSHMNLAAVAPTAFSTSIDYAAPRNPPTLIYPLSVEIPDANTTPELNAHDASTWPSSASDSNYSTPSDNSRHPRYWPPALPQRSPSLDYPHDYNHLSPFSYNASAGLEMATTSAALVYPSAFVTSPATAHHTHIFGSTLDVPTSFADEPSLLDPHHHHHHHHHRTQQPHPFLPLTTVRNSPTPPPTATSTQSSETLVTSSSAGLPSDRIMNPLASGRKEGGASGAHLLAAPTAAGALAAGCVSFSQLPRAVRASVPAYLDAYWNRFRGFPLVHRAGVEAMAAMAAATGTPEMQLQMDVLRCAMAAIGAQFVDGKEDRVRGNHLHEFAWQQSRYVSSSVRSNPSLAHVWMLLFHAC